MPLLFPVKSKKESEKEIKKQREGQLELQVEEKQEPKSKPTEIEKLSRSQLRQKIEEKYNSIYGLADIDREGFFSTRKAKFQLTKGIGKETGQYRIYQIEPRRGLLCLVKPFNRLDGLFYGEVEMGVGQSRKYRVSLMLDILLRPVLDEASIASSGRKMKLPREINVSPRSFKIIEK
jgi:hypothetical protein